MLELTKEEIEHLLDINKKILFKLNVRRKTLTFNIMKTVNREHYLLGREEKSLTPANKEELASIDEKLEEYYNDLIPYNNEFIFHNEIKRMLYGKSTAAYINPLEAYKYYNSRGDRMTLVKFFALISQNNAKFTKGDTSPIAVSENLLGTLLTIQDVDEPTIINILSNHLATIEIEYQKQATNLIDIKRVNRVNKELVITLERCLIENNISLPIITSNEQPEISKPAQNDNFEPTVKAQPDKTLKKQI